MNKLVLGGVMALVMCTALSSCNDDEEGVAMSNVEVRFSSQIQTRVVDNQWEEGDEIGIFMHYSNGSLSDATVVDNVSNFKYLASTTGSITPATDLDKMYYPVSSAVSFIAYYPFDNVEDYKVRLDVSNQKRKSEIDFLYSNNQKNVQSTTSALALNFEHKMSKVIFTIKAGYGISSADLTGLSLTLRKAITEASFSLTDATFTLGTEALDVKALTTETTDGVKAEAIMIPQECNNVAIIVSLASGKNFMYTLSSDQKWLSGKSYNYEINLTDKTVNASLSASITDWTEGEVGNVESVTSQAWSGANNTSWYAPDLSAMTLFQPEDLAGLAKLVNEGNTFEGKTIYLSADVDLNNLEWTPVGNTEETPFKGTFVGGGHQIKNLNATLKGSYNMAGLFGYSEGSIQNILVSGSCKAETDKVGLIYIGSICSINYGNIEGCRNYVNITGRMALVSDDQTNIYVGGITGLNYGTISASQNYGSISVENINTNEKAYIHMGGISGGNSNLITGCENTRNLIARNSQVRAGGIAGLTSANTKLNPPVVGAIVNSTNIGDIIVEASHNVASAGGIVGRHSSGATIESVTNKGNINISLTAGEMVYGGGLVGQLDSAFVYSGNNQGNITVVGISGDETHATAGGIVGYNINKGEVHQAINSGIAEASVATNCYSGGIAGFNKADDGATVYSCCTNDGIPARWIGNATADDDLVDDTEHSDE